MEEYNTLASEACAAQRFRSSHVAGSLFDIELTHGGEADVRPRIAEKRWRLDVLAGTKPLSKGKTSMMASTWASMIRTLAFSKTFDLSSAALADGTHCNLSIDAGLSKKEIRVQRGVA